MRSASAVLSLVCRTDPDIPSCIGIYGTAELCAQAGVLGAEIMGSDEVPQQGLRGVFHWRTISGSRLTTSLPTSTSSTYPI